MSLWKVKVQGGCYIGDGEQREDTFTVFITAKDSHDAAIRAHAHVESTAELGPMWKWFELRECARVAVPFTIAVEKGKVKPRPAATVTRPLETQ